MVDPPSCDRRFNCNSICARTFKQHPRVPLGWNTHPLAEEAFWYAVKVPIREARKWTARREKKRMLGAHVERTPYNVSQNGSLLLSGISHRILLYHV